MTQPVMRNANGTIGDWPKQKRERKPPGFTAANVVFTIEREVFGSRQEASSYISEIEKCAARIVKMAKDAAAAKPRK